MRRTERVKQYVLASIEEIKEREVHIMKELYALLERMEGEELLPKEEVVHHKNLLAEVFGLIQEQRGLLLYCKEKGLITQRLHEQAERKLENVKTELCECRLTFDYYLRRY